ncbi:Pycsar system effector family protein [Streptomyces microflavus]|uniref:Pycsar system effector family protein n=1 Tax=Streptomyces microflavus TaxID=1919 RepID=UPI003451E46A
MPRTVPQETALDIAWRIHAVLMDWMGKIDAKATFALSLELAILTALATLTVADGPRPLHLHKATIAVAAYWVAFGLLVASVMLSVYAVAPRLRTENAARDRSGGFIYFGHLRHWNPAALTEAISTERVLPVVSQQLVEVSRICWRKHRIVQCSLILAALGFLLATAVVATG